MAERGETSGAGVTPDQQTAEAFSKSWNTVGVSSVYTFEQFEEWFAPIDLEELKGNRVLELGFGNGSLLYHFDRFDLAQLEGIELGPTAATAYRNLRHFPEGVVRLHQGDLTTADLGQFDLVYCIGVIHHLQNPEDGFRAVLRHVKPGGRFHCWVYAREGNLPVRLMVEPLRKIASRLPWWIGKFGMALPLSVPFYVWAKSIARLRRVLPWVEKLPLSQYAVWIARREFRFFWHVAFDQLVTPQTAYIARSTIEEWMHDPSIQPDSRYIILRNGNSWKFGGRRRA